MIEIYINPKFVNEKPLLKERFKNFNFFQIADPAEFKAQNKKSEIKFEGNYYHKEFNLIAN